MPMSSPMITMMLGWRVWAWAWAPDAVAARIPTPAVKASAADVKRRVFMISNPPIR